MATSHMFAGPQIVIYIIVHHLHFWDFVLLWLVVPVSRKPELNTLTPLISKLVWVSTYFPAEKSSLLWLMASDQNSGQAE